MGELRLNDLFNLDPFETNLRNLLRPWHTDGIERAPQIKLDLSEQDDSYVVKADIPGVSKEDIEVRIDNNQVTISAEVKNNKEEKEDGRVLRSEREYGFASRTFSLASAVDEDKSDAKYENGVLTLKLKKHSSTTSKRLAIG